MSYPNNYCGACPVWLGLGESEGLSVFEGMAKYCTHCKIFTSQQFVCHIPTGSVYALEADGKTVVVAGVAIQPKIDGEVFWKYVDKYTYTPPVPADMFHHNKEN